MENQFNGSDFDQLRTRFIVQMEKMHKSLPGEEQVDLLSDLNSLWVEAVPDITLEQFHVGSIQSIMILQINHEHPDGKYLKDGVNAFRKAFGMDGKDVSQEFCFLIDQRIEDVKKRQKQYVREALMTMDPKILSHEGGYPVEIIKYIQGKQIEITDAVKTVNRQFKAKYHIAKDLKLRNKIIGKWKTALSVIS